MFRSAKLIACLAVAGCMGDIEGTMDEPGEPPIDKSMNPEVPPGTLPPGTVPPPPSCQTLSPGPAPIRRLTRFEYNNTVRQLLDDTSNPADAFAPEEVALGWDNNAFALGVTPLVAEQYLNAAEALAEKATADLPKLLKCDPAITGEAKCAQTFIDAFGKRAYRRPLTTEDRTRLTKVYTDNRAAFDFRTGISAVVQTALLSSSFFYRVELTPAGATGPVKLGPWELASRLSYLLWNSMPDDALFAVAESGALTTREQIAAQAQRLLADPKAKAVVRRFHQQWLGLTKADGLEKDKATFPTFTADLGPLFRQESERFIEQVIWQGSGDYRQLFTAPYTFINAKLSTFYGMDPVTGTAWQQVTPTVGERSGVLSQGSLMATLAKNNQTDPITRGKFVREHFFCQTLPDPPPGVNVTVPVPTPNSSTRERFARHSSDPACSGCHLLLDKLGFGFENYDGVGKWRTTDTGRAVDASGEIAGTDVEGPFRGVRELGAKLGGSKDVRSCMTLQYFRFSYGRGETDLDECTVKYLNDAFAKSGYRPRDLLVALTQTDSFLYRPAIVAGGTP